MSQPTLWDVSPDGMDAEFAAFHAAHPEVYRELVQLARRSRDAGRERVGIKMLWEVVRWHRHIEGLPDGEYKLNNNLTSRYARLIMQKESDLAGIFETRKLKSGGDAC